MTQKINQAPAWHRYDAAGVIRRMQSHESGLSTEEARKRLSGIGPNKLPSRKRKNVPVRFLAHSTDALSCSLLLAATLTATAERWLETAIILAVITINALAGWLQHSDEENALKNLAGLLPEQTLVRRDGIVALLATSELVPGDIVILNAGDKAPADLRLITTHDLQVDETLLTGRCGFVAKQAAAIISETPAGQCSNMLFSGSTIVSGSATGIAVATGSKMELGKICCMLTAIKPSPGPLLKRLCKGFLLTVTTTIAFLFFYSLLRHGLPLIELLPRLSGLILAAIPAGLPTIIVLTLMMGARTMAKKNILIRKLPATEKLGAVSVICSDKKGVLTSNEMTVKALILHNETIRVEGNGYRPEGRFLQEKGYSVVEPAAHAQLSRLLQNLDLCNDSALLQDKQGKWRITGNPELGALKVAAAKAHIPGSEVRLLAKLPFDNARKYQATRHLINGVDYLLATGEPEALLSLCDFQQTAQGLAPLDIDFWRQRLAQHAGEGLQAIASAWRLADENQPGLDHDYLQQGLIFCGMATLIDPPRQEVTEAIARCHRAGVQVKMFADERPATALVMGRMLGIGDGRSALDSRHLEAMTDAELALAASRHDIFLNFQPQHKRRLVEALQSQGETVAITGHGVYDTPALKQADVGIALGDNSAEAAKEVADIITGNGSFASLADAVQEGQRIRDSLKKIVRFVLPVCLAQTLLFIFATMAGKMTPLMPLQILWINIIASITLALSLIFRKTDAQAMRTGRCETTSSEKSRLFWQSCLVGVLIMLFAFAVEDWLQAYGHEPAFIHTLLLQVIVVAQIAWIVSCHEPEGFPLHTGLLKSHCIWLTGGLLVLLQLAVTAWPPMNKLFGTTPLPLDFWLIALASGALLFTAFELEKLLLRRELKK
ncbi:HAD-IC family P-type ATPase [Kalamiella sp. sgz302252]|uniref:HAD-IC family P-type ATPase n=1 Tax=Pantoea sp. sgz302252 TaxID=3341827 RepID=UPI0036D40427